MAAAGGQNVVGGDDVHAIVVDIGSHVTRIGSAGDDSPKSVIPSYVGIHDNESNEGVKKRALIGGDDILVKPRSFEDVCGVFGEDDGDRLDVEKLGCVMRNGLGSLGLLEKGEGGGRPMLIVEPSVGFGDGEREKVLEIAFGEFGASAAFIARGAAMAAFAAARTTATVVEVGHRWGLAVPVVEGYVLEKCIKRLEVGGRVLTRELMGVVEKRLGSGEMEVEGEKQDTRIRSWHEIRKKKKKNEINVKLEEEGNGNVAEGKNLWDVTDLSKTPDFKKFTARHRMFYRRRVVEDMKMGVVRVPPSDIADAGDSTDKKNESAPEQDTSEVTYELPDGNVLELGEDGRRIGSMLFENGGIPKLAYDAVTACDMDVRRDLFSGVVVTGGTTVMKGFHERFTKELAILTPQMFKLKVMTTPTNVEKSAGPWIGGSIVASLGTFQQNWISKSDFDENGAARAVRKCP
eukprot:Plantae.Rhodophyta-Hildenbrandia_rubra.ctg789.p1 GENE.Plantae.Rhodophyta-Hildenbrandia_rubra.ctg789~~Plantae.Rhodophyta-Hildenbrandia_rubra.ctg789.p1  ORF type:complete len:461 (+),score=132.94 Plantae.Rhodophyta-Hildenbrandia_rubra.ctg789:154-1536(+)